MTTLTIWACAAPPPDNSGPLVFWQAFLPIDPPATWHSLPEEVHRDRERIRSQYLSWLHDVGVAVGKGGTLIDRMVIRPGLSYWWMTIPADSSLAPNSPAYVAARMMALAPLADRLKITQIDIIGADRPTTQLLKQWARSSGRQASVTARTSIHSTRRARERLYNTVPPLGALRVLLAHLGLPRRARAAHPVTPIEGITFVDYLAHLGPAAATEGRFDSNYWGPLVDVLDEADEPANWLHISADLASGRVIDRDAKLVTRFNTNTASQTHRLLHTYLSWGVVARSFRDYLRVCDFGIRVRNKARVFTDSKSRVPLWHAFLATYRDQFFGKAAMLNCIWINLFREAFANQPSQRLGIYVFENQPWEMALITAWRAAGHGELIGVAHTTTLYWDTRYFKDPRDLWPVEGNNPMPWPDQVAVNGPAMRTHCLRAGYPATRMVDVEALRYLDIQQELPPPQTNDPIRVLVCGEYSYHAAQRILDVVNEALDTVEVPLTATYRPHPAYVGPPVRLHQSMSIDPHKSVREALGDADVAICGTTSSVCLEALSSSPRTFLIADSNFFVTSLRDGLAGGTWISNGVELASALSSGMAQDRPISIRDVFDIQNETAKWRKVLGTKSR